MAQVRLPEESDYWATGGLYCAPNVTHAFDGSRLMTRDVYAGIKAVLAFENPHRATQPRQKGEVPKIGAFLEMFRAVCIGNYTPDRDLSLDEQILRFTGSPADSKTDKIHTGTSKLKFLKQNKPTPEGLKMWAVCEPEHGGRLVTFELAMRDGRPIEDTVVNLLGHVQEAGHVVQKPRFI
jgi:hypothetical protein